MKKTLGSLFALVSVCVMLFGAVPVSAVSIDDTPDTSHPNFYTEPGSNSAISTYNNYVLGVMGSCARSGNQITIVGRCTKGFSATSPQVSVSLQRWSGTTWVTLCTYSKVGSTYAESVGTQATLNVNAGTYRTRIIGSAIYNRVRGSYTNYAYK